MMKFATAQVVDDVPSAGDGERHIVPIPRVSIQAFCETSDLAGSMQAAVGDLEKVKRIVKVMSLVNSAPDFTEQHLVTNGASELLGQVFGDRGAHARSAFGVAQIPMGACVEIELIAEVE